MQLPFKLGLSQGRADRPVGALTSLVLVGTLAFQTRFLNWALLDVIPSVRDSVDYFSNGEAAISATRLIAGWQPCLTPWWTKGTILAIEALAVWLLWKKREPILIVLLICLASTMMALAFMGLYAPFNIVDIVP